MTTKKDKTLQLWKPSFNRLKKSVFSRSPNTTDHLQLDTLPLPVELLILILSHLQRPADLSRVCLTCRTLRNIAEPLLYAKVFVSVPEGLKRGMRLPQLTILYRTLALQRIGEHVTVFRTYLARWATCPKFDVESHSPSMFRRCSCDKLDRLVGTALENLPNLQDLRLHCYLCRDPTDSRHHYLSQLPTRSLRELSFMCTCASGGNGQNLAHGILSSPSSSTIEKLGVEWSLGSRRAPLSPPLAALFDDPHFLEKVYTLQHDGSVLADTILSKRHITRLAYQRGLSPISPYDRETISHEQISRHPGRLTHFMAKDAMRGLSAAIAENPQAYRNLKYIGSLHFPHSSINDILLAMKPFTALPSLKMIDVHCDPWDPDNKTSAWIWNKELLDRLELQHPSLQMAYLAARNLMITVKYAVLWERRDKWQSRKVSRMKYWDIINGEIDNL